MVIDALANIWGKQ